MASVGLIGIGTLGLAVERLAETAPDSFRASLRVNADQVVWI